jgi:biotin transport system substrate-specific component
LKLRSYILASLFASLTAAGSFIRFPIGPIPFTLQDFFVLLSGALLGPRFGPLSQGLYLFIGLTGLPVFSLGGGPGYIFQPTFGYLLGFPLASFVIGYLLWGQEKQPRHREFGLGRILLANTLGSLAIFSTGVTILYLNLKYIVGQPVSPETALWSGFIVFIPGSIIKIIASAYLSQRLLRHL